MASEEQKLDALVGQAPDMTKSVALTVLREFEGDVVKAARTLREMTMEFPHLAQSVVSPMGQDAVREQQELLERCRREREERMALEQAERELRIAEEERVREDARLARLRAAEEEQAARLRMLEQKRAEMMEEQRRIEAEERRLEEQRLREEKEQQRVVAVAEAERAKPSIDLAASIDANRIARIQAIIRQQVEEQLRAEVAAEREALAQAREDLTKELAEREKQANSAVEEKVHQELEQRQKETAAEIQERLERQFEERFRAEIQALKGAVADQVATATRSVAPKVTICWCNNADGKDSMASSAEQQAAVAELKALLIEQGVLAEEIRDVDVASDPELAAYVRQELQKKALSVNYPVVSVMGSAIGGVEDLKSAIAGGAFAELISAGGAAPTSDASETSGAEYKDGSGEIVGEGVLDKCLNAAEYVASGVGSLLLLPVNIITYPFRSGTGELPKGPNDVDFDVLHTNWYWRNLRRKFRFYDAEFVRIHPTHMDIRARHSYESIDSVLFNSDTNMVVRYKDGSSPDFIQASSSDCKAIIATIEKKSNKKLTVWRADDLAELGHCA